jgi:hypothetical protein
MEVSGGSGGADSGKAHAESYVNGFRWIDFSFFWN